MTAVATRSHVAIVHPWVIDALLAGTKTIESRFSRDRRPPFGQVSPGETVYFRVAGGGYAARATVKKVEAYEQLTPALVSRLETKLRKRIGGDNAYWLAARRARCATLLHVHACEATRDGPELDRQRGDRRAWFVLSESASRRSRRS